jgi:hypothetical protein
LLGGFKKGFYLDEVVFLINIEEMGGGNKHANKMSNIFICRSMGQAKGCVALQRPVVKAAPTPHTSALHLIGKENKNVHAHNSNFTSYSSICVVHILWLYRKCEHSKHLKSKRDMREMMMENKNTGMLFTSGLLSWYIQFFFHSKLEFFCQFSGLQKGSLSLR